MCKKAGWARLGTEAKGRRRSRNVEDIGTWRVRRGAAVARQGDGALYVATYHTISTLRKSNNYKSRGTQRNRIIQHTFN